MVSLLSGLWAPTAARCTLPAASIYRFCVWRTANGLFSDGGKFCKSNANLLIKEFLLYYSVCFTTIRRRMGHVPSRSLVPIRSSDFCRAAIFAGRQNRPLLPGNRNGRVTDASKSVLPSCRGRPCACPISQALCLPYIAGLVPALYRRPCACLIYEALRLPAFRAVSGTRRGRPMRLPGECPYKGMGRMRT